jgi:hypothetical protein
MIHYARFGLMLTAVPAFLAPPCATLADGVLQFGDKDILNLGTYTGDPTSGATLMGLAPGVVTPGAPATGHGFPFSPQPTDFPGTDQIYVGSNQTGTHDGYSNYAGRLHGPQQLILDYTSLVPAGRPIQTLTLGIAFDDFQQPVWSQPYILRINGHDFAPLSSLASSLNQTGPFVRFYSIGIDPALLTTNNILTFTIDQGGDGGDGWAVDFLTVGVTTGTACYPNCDSSTAAPILNVNDFICFQTRFANGDSYANCDNSTSPPILNVNDFICFQTRFANGCP